MFTKIKRYLKNLLRFTNKNLNVITLDMYLWNNKPIKENSVLLWDLENIPFNRLQDIKKQVKYTPQDLYVVTKQPLSLIKRIAIEKQQFKILDAHKTISDDKIISIMKLYVNKPNMILISSDSDFVQVATSYVKENKLHWIITDSIKKAIIMKMDISNTYLTITTLSKMKLSPSQIKRNIKRKANYKKLQPNIQIQEDTLYKDLTAYLVNKNIDMYTFCKNVAPHHLYRVLESYRKSPNQYHYAFKQEERGLEYFRFVHKVLYTEYAFLDYLSKASDGKLNIQKICKKYSYQEFKDTISYFKKKSNNKINIASPSSNYTDIYRSNHQNKRVVCGKIQMSSSNDKVLLLYSNLQKKYEMPEFDKKILFSQIYEVSEFIHFNVEFHIYELNTFQRKDYKKVI